MRIEKTLIATGLKAKNKSDWEGKVLLYPSEYKAVLEDRNITEVKYDHADGKGKIAYNGDKIREAKRQFLTSKSGKDFVVFQAKDIT
jgi:hypothetical protein